MTASVNHGLWTAAEAAAATGGKSTGDWLAEGVSIDSRTIAPDDLFVAIHGPNIDGHDFVAEALAAHAAAAVIHRRVDGLAADAPLLEVADTTRALADMAAHARGRTAAQVCAITGSVGKTGTKELLAHVLASQAKTHASAGNLNNHWGLPLSLSRLPMDARFAVFEMGMNHPGEIVPLTRLARPHVAVITTVAAVHLEFFDSVEQIADAKAEIFDGLEPGGIAILNRDNAQYDRLAATAHQAGVERIVGFGVHSGAWARLVDHQPTAAGAHVQASIGGRHVAYDLSVAGRHWAMNSLAVLAAVEHMGGDVRAAANAMAGFVAPKGRGRRTPVRLDGGEAMLVDESYNASPIAVRAALEVLATTPLGEDGRRIAVLGDMLELGSDAAALHRELAADVVRLGIDRVYCAGQYMGALYEALPAEIQAGWAASTSRLADTVAADVRPGDVVMVKGSYGSRTGLVVDAVLALDRRGNGG